MTSDVSEGLIQDILFGLAILGKLDLSEAWVEENLREIEVEISGLVDAIEDPVEAATL